MLNTEHFFETARERYRIMLRKQANESRPWTDDPIFHQWRFCCVHREDDRTTQWFRKNIRSQLDGVLLSNDARFKLVFATIAFRWFNRIETVEKITDLFLGQWNSDEAERRLRDVKPIVSGAYIILGCQGMEKLEGVLRCIDTAAHQIRSHAPGWGVSLREAWTDLQLIPYMGRFMAYEVVTDLRHTSVLNRAEDIDTWANAGPGCARGLGWITKNDPTIFNRNSNRDQEEMLGIMRELLEDSRHPHFWLAEWKKWELREVEHWLCEYDKYRRAQSGERLKRRY